MIFKVGLCGASGRMGLEVAGILREGYKNLELADAVVGKSNLAEIEGISTRKMEEPPREPVHVWIDFSRPEATFRLLQSTKAPVVIATTGFDEAQTQKLREYSRDRAILLAPNTSPGMAVLRRMLRSLPDNLAENFQVLLAEEHHRHKVDAPSGTAKQLKSLLSERGLDCGEVAVVRAGKMPGTHTLRLVSDEEELEITHRAYDRRVFARGALEAARFLASAKPGWFSMEDVYGQL